MGKTVSLIWFPIGAMGIVALAAGAEESRVRTNILWDVLGAFWVAGWNVMSNAQRTQMWSWRGTGGGRGEEDDFEECFVVRIWVGIRRKQHVVEVFDCVLYGLLYICYHISWIALLRNSQVSPRSDASHGQNTTPQD
jgi:hypothetical protein